MYLEEGQDSRSKLEREFDEKVQKQSIKFLLPALQGLMKFRPSDRISIAQALDFVRSAMAIREAEMMEETDESITDSDPD